MQKKEENYLPKNKFLPSSNRLAKGKKNWFVTFGHRFADGSIGTKISHFIMGFGNFYHKQIIKGLLYFIIEAGFAFLMIFSPKVNDTPIGAKALVNLITLGTNEGDIFTNADNSMLMLLFGVITWGIIFLFIFAYNSNLKSSYKSDLEVRKGKKPSSFKDDLKDLLDGRFHVAMLTPSIIGIITFTVLPTIFMILIAFTNYDSLHLPPNNLFDWVGLDNFIAIFSGSGNEISARFGSVLGWTIIWAFFATFTCYIGGILLALVINNKHIKAKKLWRTIFVLTIALPQFISLLAVRNILSKEGPFNALLVFLGIIEQGNGIQFLGSADSILTAKIMVIVINMWIGIPYTMLMTSGILMNVPAELYEAAQIDGATKRQAFYHITVPYILFVTSPYLIT
ncbi:MAG TPA: sugar ABC transporter permease [Candidatus Izemoplasmatales bacterium]|nr:sugar ABC transporter permease [Candidatus Izemoplasmatales bacterium]